MQTNIKNKFFYFNKRERTAIFVILFLAVACFSAPYFYEKILDNRQKESNDYSAAFTKFSSLVKENPQTWTNKESNYENNYSNFDEHSKTSTLFYFDPNTLSVDGWQKLGVSYKTSLGIKKYTDKGGRFRTSEDIKKIWGISPKMQDDLLPFVKIAENNADNNYSNKSFTDYPKKIYEKPSISPVDVNKADTAAFISLPGIGPAYARRIAKFRDLLGGFYSINQIKETYGLPDSSFQKIKPYLQLNSTAIKKININEAGFDELKKHPYCGYANAKLILSYRKEHGNFKSISELKNIMAIGNDVYDKLSPYLSL